MGNLNFGFPRSGHGPALGHFVFITISKMLHYSFVTG